MSFLLPFAPLLFGGAAVKAIGSLVAPKPKVAAPLRPPTRNAAADALAASDRLSNRRGAAANATLGARGAESSAGGKIALGA